LSSASSARSLASFGSRACSTRNRLHVADAHWNSPAAALLTWATSLCVRVPRYSVSTLLTFFSSRSDTWSVRRAFRNAGDDDMDFLTQSQSGRCPCSTITAPNTCITVADGLATHFTSSKSLLRTDLRLVSALSMNGSTASSSSLHSACSASYSAFTSRAGPAPAPASAAAGTAVAAVSAAALSSASSARSLASFGSRACSTRNRLHVADAHWNSPAAALLTWATSLCVRVPRYSVSTLLTFFSSRSDTWSVRRAFRNAGDDDMDFLTQSQSGRCPCSTITAPSA